MMIIMHTTATKEEIANVVSRVEELKLSAHRIDGSERKVLGVVGDGRPVEPSNFIRLPGVSSVIPISKPYKLASREFYPKDSLVPIGKHLVGNGSRIIIGGPCAVESREQLFETAKAVKAAGAHALRGGAFKPRTSPYSFQGLGEAGLEILAEARQATGMPVVSEVMREEQIPVMTQYVDVLQVGARNMQNYALLHAVGEAQRPVLLKRGMMSTIEELLMADIMPRLSSTGHCVSPMTCNRA